MTERGRPYHQVRVAYLAALILLIAGADSMAQEPSTTEDPVRTWEVFRLSYAQAADVRRFIEPVLSPEGTVVSLASLVAQEKPVLPQSVVDRINADSMDEGDVGLPRHSGAVADLSNVLLVHDYAAHVRIAADVVARLDQRPKQILLSLKVLRFMLGDEFDLSLGARYQSDGTPEALVETGDFPNSLNYTDWIGGISGSIQWSRFALLLEAAEGQDRLRHLASPELLVSDGQTAGIFSGTQMPFEEILVLEGGTTFRNTDFQNAGTKMLITPRINGDGRVHLNITSEVSNLVAPREPDTVNIPASAKNITSATTTMVLRDGEAMVLGGLISQQRKKSTSRVPLLGRIPVLGLLFGSTDWSTHYSEIIIVLRPQIIDDESPLMDQRLQESSEREKELENSKKWREILLED